MLFMAHVYERVYHLSHWEDAPSKSCALLKQLGLSRTKRKTKAKTGSQNYLYCFYKFMDVEVIQHLWTLASVGEGLKVVVLQHVLAKNLVTPVTGDLKSLLASVDTHPPCGIFPYIEPVVHIKSINLLKMKKLFQVLQPSDSTMHQLLLVLSSLLCSWFCGMKTWTESWYHISWNCNAHNLWCEFLDSTVMWPYPSNEIPASNSVSASLCMIYIIIC